MSTSPFEQDPHGARARWLLLAGATLGLAAATSTLLATPEANDSLPDAIVARVNGTPIRTESYLRLLAALAADRRNPLSAADRKHVLDRLIEEELLVQHAVDLGLVRTDRRVRANLVSAILASLNATADAIEPSKSELEAFYRDNLGYFRLPARWRVQAVFIASPAGDPDRTDARLRAEQVTARLRAGGVHRPAARSAGRRRGGAAPERTASARQASGVSGTQRARCRPQAGAGRNQ